MKTSNSRKTRQKSVISSPFLQINVLSVGVWGGEVGLTYCTCRGNVADGVAVQAEASNVRHVSPSEGCRLSKLGAEAVGSEHMWQRYVAQIGLCQFLRWSI